MEKKDLMYLMSISAFLLILLSLLIILNTPLATGYEISIYDAYSPLFWVIVILTYLIGFSIMLFDLFGKTKNRWWAIGFFILLFNNTLILLLPLFRGYLTYGRGDVLSHIGYVKDIILSGNLYTTGYSENFYPILHLLMVNINYLTGIKPEILALTLPIIFTLFYMVGIYLLSTTLTQTHWKRILITAFGSILLFKHENLMIAPSVLAFFILPLIILIYYKTRIPHSQNSLNYSIILLLILFIIPFLHPGEGTLFLIPIFLIINTAPLLLKKRGIIKEYNSRTVLNISFIVLILWFIWLGSFSTWAIQINAILGWLFKEVGTTTATQYLSTLQKAQLTSIDTLQILFKSYGQYVLYSILSLFIGIFTLKNLFKRKKIDIEQFRFAVLFFFFAGFTFLTFISFLGVEYGRVLRYVVFSATILNGIGIYELFKTYPRKNILKSGLVIFLVLVSIFAVFNTFPSPDIYSNNYQVTKMEFVGINWFLDSRDMNTPIETIDLGTTTRLFDGVKGVNYWDTTGGEIDSTTDHFNYDKNEVYGKSLKKSVNSYFINYELAEVYFPEVIPNYRNQWRFTPEDFSKFEKEDVSVNKIYSNGEFWVYYVTYFSNESLV